MKDQPPIDDGRTPRPGELQDGQPRDQMQKIADEAIGILNETAWKDCFGYDSDEQSECDCEVCIARRAIDKLQQLADPVVRSLHEGRNTGAERVFFEAWVSENTRKSGINSGLTIIEAILATKFRSGPLPGLSEPVRPFVSQRDMDVATAVIQWLGTNCGRCFVDKCEREIETQRIERSETKTDWWSLRVEFPEGKDRDRIESIARQIANESSQSEARREQVAGMLSKAMKWAWQSGKADSLLEAANES